MKITKRDLRDGSISIRIGKETTRLQTSGEARAFMAGAEVARATLLHEIGDFTRLRMKAATPKAEGQS